MRRDAPSRREVLRLGAAAGTVGALGAGAALVPDSLGGAWWQGDAATAGTHTDGVLDVYVNEGLARMVDGSLVYMRGFGDRPTAAGDPSPSLTLTPHAFFADGRLVQDRLFPPDAAAPVHGETPPARPDPTNPLLYLARRRYWGSFFPRRTIVAESGSTIRLRVHNGLEDEHELALVGISASTGRIPPGGIRDLEVTAPAPGTYLYVDPGGDGVERTLGLAGVIVVVPAEDHWRLTAGGVEFERQWVWLCHDVEPEWGERARRGERIDPRRTPAVPRYFMLNDRAGFESLAASTDETVNHASHEESLPEGAPRRTDVRDFSLAGDQDTVITGQLLRMVNTGVVVHQMHFHGNHVWTLGRNGRAFDRAQGVVDGEGHVVLQQWEDVVELDPLDRKEVMLPLKPPPDALAEVFAARRDKWKFPMHCHAEPSQTAAGGLYPGGLVADWVLALPTKGGTS